MLRKTISTVLMGSLMIGSAYAAEKFSDQDIVKFQNAASRGKIEVVKEYINKGIDVNVQDFSKEDTALIKAAKFCQVDIAKLLLSSGANKAIKDFDGKIASDHAKKSSFHEGCKAIEELL